MRILNLSRNPVLQKNLVTFKYLRPHDTCLGAVRPGFHLSHSLPTGTLHPVSFHPLDFCEQDDKICPTGSPWPPIRTITGACTVGGKPDGDHHDLLSFLMAYRRMSDTHPPSNRRSRALERSGNVDVSQRYSEAFGYLYALNVFSFQDARAMDFFIRTFLPRRLSLVRKVRIEEPGIDLGKRGMVQFSPCQIRGLLDKLTGLKELGFEHELPDEGVRKTLLGSELEETGVVVVSRRADLRYDVGYL